MHEGSFMAVDVNVSASHNVEKYNIYITVDRIDLDTRNPASRKALYEGRLVPEELSDSIEATIAYQLECGNEGLSVAIFAPSRPPETEFPKSEVVLNSII